MNVAVDQLNLNPITCEAAALEHFYPSNMLLLLLSFALQYASAAMAATPPPPHPPAPAAPLTPTAPGVPQRLAALASLTQFQNPCQTALEIAITAGSICSRTGTSSQSPILRRCLLPGPVLPKTLAGYRVTPSSPALSISSITPRMAACTTLHPRQAPVPMWR